MKRVAIVGLGWVGMPLALFLHGQGYQVVGSKTTQDGVDAACLCGIECYPLVFTPELECETDELERLLDVDVLVVTLPAGREPEARDNYRQAVQALVDSALAKGVSRVIFLSSTSVYGEDEITFTESSPLLSCSPTGQILVGLEQWLHGLPSLSVDILRLSGLIGPDRHPGRFLAGKMGVKGGNAGVNLVHQDDVIAAIYLLIERSSGGHIYNLCAPSHPRKRDFYRQMAQQLGVVPPSFDEGEDKDDRASLGRIIDGSLISRELGFEYRYSDLSIVKLD